MTNPTPHGQVPDALRLAEEITNLECSSEAVAKTIAAAADELCRLHVENASLRASPTASPTPPAEQQAPKETSGGFHVWRDISTAPKDGSRFVAMGYNYGLYSEGRHICVAQWFRGCWMEASDWNETSELKYLTHWMPLPSPPDNAAELNDLNVSVSPQQAAPKAAPQQGAQEPVATLHCNDVGYVWARATEVGKLMRFEQPLNLYAAPQPAPASPIRIGWGRDYLDNGKPIDASAAPVPDFAAILQQEAQEPCPTCAALAAESVVRDAERYRGLKALAKECLLRPSAARAEILPDMRTHWQLPTLMCSGPVGGFNGFDEAVDAALAAQRGNK